MTLARKAARRGERTHTRHAEAEPQRVLETGSNQDRVAPDRVSHSRDPKWNDAGPQRSHDGSSVPAYPAEPRLRARRVEDSNDGIPRRPAAHAAIDSDNERAFAVAKPTVTMHGTRPFCRACWGCD